MSKYSAPWHKFHTAKQAAIDTIIEKHTIRLFGTPPKRTSTGTLTGALAPDMDLITRLFKK